MLIKGGLAGAVGAQQPKELTGLDVKTDAIERTDLAVAGSSC